MAAPEGARPGRQRTPSRGGDRSLAGPRRHSRHRREVGCVRPRMPFPLPAGNTRRRSRPTRRCCRFWNPSGTNGGGVIVAVHDKYLVLASRHAESCRGTSRSRCRHGNPRPGHGSRPPLRDRAAAERLHADVLHTAGRGRLGTNRCRSRFRALRVRAEDDTRDRNRTRRPHDRTVHQACRKRSRDGPGELPRDPFPARGVSFDCRDRAGGNGPMRRGHDGGRSEPRAGSDVLHASAEAAINPARGASNRSWARTCTAKACTTRRRSKRRCASSGRRNTPADHAGVPARSEGPETGTDQGRSSGHAADQSLDGTGDGYADRPLSPVGERQGGGSRTLRGKRRLALETSLLETLWSNREVRPIGKEMRAIGRAAGGSRRSPISASATRCRFSCMRSGAHARGAGAGSAGIMRRCAMALRGKRAGAAKSGLRAWNPSECRNVRRGARRP